MNTALSSSSSSSNTVYDHQQKNHLDDNDDHNTHVAVAAVQELIHLSETMNQRAQGMEPFKEEELDHIISSLSTARTRTRSMASSSSSSSSSPSLEQESTDESSSSPSSSTKWSLIRSLFAKVGHFSHKNWTQTAHFASELHSLLLLMDPAIKNTNTTTTTTTTQHEEDLSPEFRDIFERVLMDGNWDAAATHAAATAASSQASTTTTSHHHHIPFIVLVTGVNGIRKTTSVYQPWFEQVLQEALIYPTIMTNTIDVTNSSLSKTECTSTPSPSLPLLVLPTGHNSFFRQLDHMIATLIHTYFQLLYRLTSKMHDFTTTTTSTTRKQGEEELKTLSPILPPPPPPPKKVISLYSQFKAALFTRFRTISEMVGIIFIREAIKRKMNIMIETSGRDIAMFHYVDTFFPSNGTTTTTPTYHKLAIHFTISDLHLAEKSVDRRMIQEMKDGTQVLETMQVVVEDDADKDQDYNQRKSNVKDIIRVNAGGPYGSEVLKAVQFDSDRVWEQIISPTTTVGKDWYKATIHIEAHETEPWTAQAVYPDGSMGKAYAFEFKSPTSKV